MSTLWKCGCNGNKELDFKISPTPVGDKSQVSGKNLLPLQRYLSKTISEGENTLRPPSHRVKADHNKLHFSKTEMQDSFSWTQEVFD